MKKKVSAILIICLILILLAGAATGTYFGVVQLKRNKDISNIESVTIDFSAKNAILMIGDGMGVNHIETAKAFYSLEQLNMEKYALCSGYVNTFPKSPWTTDSAAAATAMSTGVKVKNGEISNNKGKDLETLSEYALSLGKSVGIIATEGLYGATPAAFSAHSKGRNNTSDIINSQISSGINLFMGADKKTYESYSQKLISQNYNYINDFDVLTNTLSENSQLPDKIFAVFDGISTDNQGSAVKPTLAEMTDFALEYLSLISGENGFFLMIEGSHIDKKSHSNDMNGMLKELKGFDEAVLTVTSWIDISPDDNFAIVTADHETGNLKYNGESKENINNKLFKSGSHTSQDVKIFYYGINACIAPLSQKTIDNTNISSILRQVLYNQTL